MSHFSSQTTTNETGAFNFADIRPAIYKVTIEAQGFAPFVTTIPVRVGLDTPVIAKLNVGGETTEVTVAADATTLLGALSFLPGGLGATEGSLGLLVARFAIGVSSSIAVASTLLIRLCTLWYGELVGAVAVLTFMRDPQLRAAAREAEAARAPQQPNPDQQAP